MHQISQIAHQNVVNHAGSVNHAVNSGRTMGCIDAASKRLLGRKRLTLGTLAREDARTGAMAPGRPAVRPRPEFGTRMSGETPATIWAALVITRALSS